MQAETSQRSSLFWTGFLLVRMLFTLAWAAGAVVAFIRFFADDAGPLDQVLSPVPRAVIIAFILAAFVLAAVSVVAMRRWARRSDTLAIAGEGAGAEMDERQRMLGFRAKAVAGEATLQLTLATAVAVAVFNVTLTTASVFALFAMGASVTYLISLYLASRYYSRRG